MLGRSAGGDVQRTSVFARALFAGRAGDAPHQTTMVRNAHVMNDLPAVVLGFLMEQNDLRQGDLAEDFGSQSNVGEVLSGKREINARQARALAKRFGVSSAVFI